PLLVPGLPCQGVTQLHFVGESTGCSPFGVLLRGTRIVLTRIHPRGYPLPSGSRVAVKELMGHSTPRQMNATFDKSRT
ncbi:hypothetical protein Q604_UNBC03214G0001, partial [human gut metagenome]